MNKICNCQTFNQIYENATNPVHRNVVLVCLQFRSNRRCCISFRIPAKFANICAPKNICKNAEFRLNRLQAYTTGARNRILDVLCKWNICTNWVLFKLNLKIAILLGKRHGVSIKYSRARGELFCYFFLSNVLKDKQRRYKTVQL